MWEWDESVAHCNVQKRSCKLPPQNIKSRIRTKIIYVPFSRKLYLVTKSACTFATHTHCVHYKTGDKMHQVTKRRTAHEEKFICICIILSTCGEQQKNAYDPLENISDKNIHFGQRISRENSLWVCNIAPIDRIMNLHFFSGILKLCEKKPWHCQQLHR